MVNGPVMQVFACAVKPTMLLAVQSDTLAHQKTADR